MKGVFIKWRRGDHYEKRIERKKAIRNAWRTVRQRSRLQLQQIAQDFQVEDFEVVPNCWLDGNFDNTPIAYFDEFVHPRVRLGFFD